MLGVDMSFEAFYEGERAGSSATWPNAQQRMGSCAVVSHDQYLICQILEIRMWYIPNLTQAAMIVVGALNIFRLVSLTGALKARGYISQC